MAQDRSETFGITFGTIIGTTFAMVILGVVVDMAASFIGNVVQADWSRSLGTGSDILWSYFLPVSGGRGHLIGLANFAIYTLGLSVLAAILAHVKLGLLPVLFHIGRLLVILGMGLQAAFAPATVKMQGIEMETVNSAYMPQPMRTVAVSRYVHRPARLFSWGLRPRYAAPLSRLETRLGDQTVVQIWQGLYKGKRSGVMYMEGVSNQGQQRVASVVSPFEAEHFAGPVRDEFVSQGGRRIGTQEMLGLPVDVWELSKNGAEVKVWVATSTEFPWILRREVKQDGRLLLSQEVTRFADDAAIPFSNFVLPGYVNPPREVETIGPDKLKAKP